jgi:hypothetical protein
MKDGRRAMRMIREYVTAAFAALWVYGVWDAVSTEYFHPPC